MTYLPRPAAHVFLDLETTGLDPRTDAITEMAWIFAETERHFHVAYDGFPTLWSARNTAAYSIEREGQIAQREAALATLFSDCLDLAAGGAIDVYLVGANPSFDASFLAPHFREVPWRHALIDVEAMAMGAFGWDAPRPLRELRAALGIPGANEHPHDALHDAREAKLVFEAILARQKGTSAS